MKPLMKPLLAGKEFPYQLGNLHLHWYEPLPFARLNNIIAPRSIPILPAPFPILLNWF